MRPPRRRRRATNRLALDGGGDFGGVVDICVFFFALLGFQGVENGCGGYGGDDGHQDQHGEECGRDGAEVERDVEDDKFHQAACVHQNAERGGLTPR
jgi:hypothetical protein